MVSSMAIVSIAIMSIVICDFVVLLAPSSLTVVREEHYAVFRRLSSTLRWTYCGQSDSPQGTLLDYLGLQRTLTAYVAGVVSLNSFSYI